jgi:hypothetical protein
MSLYNGAIEADFNRLPLRWPQAFCNDRFKKINKEGIATLIDF